jgi:hypothetical protein
VRGIVNLLIVLLLLPLFVQAETKVYKIIDKQGNPVFTDKPQQGAETVILPPISTFDTLPPARDENADGTEIFGDDEEGVSEVPIQAYTQLSITSPKTGSAFWAGGGNLLTIIDLVPPLFPGDTIKILLDGSLINEATEQKNSFEYPDVSRGEHTLQATVVDKDGNTRITSDSVTFQMHRPAVGR